MESGRIGDVKLARSLCDKRRKSIGQKVVFEPLTSVDYNLWVAPAEMRPVTRSQYHCDWQYHRGNGLGMDIDGKVVEQFGQQASIGQVKEATEAFCGDDNNAANADQPLTSPTIGGKLMRDPSIVRGPDGVYRMVWSSSWSDLGFGYSSSKDLIHWSEHRFLPVNEKIAGAENTWAPDLYYDASTQQFVMTYAATIPGRFPETDAGGDHNHRLYWVMTRDFVIFSEPALALDPGYNCIDGTIVAMNGGLTMIYKDERPGQKKLHAVTTTGLGESWTKSTTPILQRDWVEGPTVLKVGNVWRLYFDCYKEGHFGAAESSDGIHWRDTTESLKMPHGVRHGTAFAVPASILQPLRKLTGT